MSLMFGSVATLAVVLIYWLWHAWYGIALQRKLTLRNRVAYLLWVVADYRT